MPSRIIVVVNGHPRSGKDTATEFLQAHCDKRQIPTAKVSSIDPVFQMLHHAGISMKRNQLSDADRDLLAEVGSAVEKHSHFRTGGVLRFAKAFFSSVDVLGRDKAIVWVHMREPENIARLKTLAEEDGLHFATLFIERPGVREINSNVADASVLDMKYDFIVRNGMGFSELRDACGYMLDALLKEALV